MATVTTVIEIAASPAHVRSLFLDFPAYPAWHTGHFKSITVPQSTASRPAPGTSTSEPVGARLAAGDKLQINLRDGMSFKAVVAENTAHRFVWRGGWSHVVVGEHSFQFDPSTSMPGGTTLTQAETFTGGLVTVCKPFLKSDENRTSPGFEKFNADLKQWAEGGGRQMLD